MLQGKASHLLGSVLVCALFAVSAQAGVVDLGAGWQAIWDNSLDGLVDINVVTIIDIDGEDAIVIQKSAEFTQGPVFGVFPSIPIVFQQTAFPAAAHIVIDDEIITNSTGEDWTDFHFDLLDAGDVVFDPVRTAASGGGPPIGFFISPFTNASFSGDLMSLDIDGGVLPAGGVWFPGDGALNGQLWIDMTVATTAPFTTFVLKETPTPEPASIMLVMLGAGAMALRRRRA